MKVSYQWLCEIVDIRHVAPSDLAIRLTSAGLTVDGVERRVEGVSGVVVGLVKACEQHPNADRLRVCQVQVNDSEVLTIVCGAPNVAAGQKVAVAVSGSTLPSGKIGKAKLRGIESNGMLCSAKEIGLETKLLPKEQTEGLYILPEDATIGADVVEYLHLDDYIIDVDLTPNRSDCLSIRGLAYEIGALYDRPVHLPDPVLPTVGEPGPVRVLLDTDRCPRYDAQVLTGLVNRPAPMEIQMRLMTMGVRPINAVVDVTNYVMLEWGQPLHAFDFDEVRQETIVVRLAKDSEEIVTLDGETRKLTSDVIVISDPERAIGIAGVMGGENSEITSKTKRIVLESASFDAKSVRRTGQRLGLRSEAQQRFEKGIDELTISSALRRATELYISILGASLVGDAVSVSNPVKEMTKDDAESGRVSGAEIPFGFQVSFSPERCRALLGAQIDDAAMKEVFVRLGFTATGNGREWTVVVPRRRPDVRREADLVEEVARFVGYDTIPSTLPQGATTAGVRTLHQRVVQTTRRALLSTGMDEVFTYAFTHPSKLDALRIPEDSKYRNMIPLALPMSEERTVLRTHLLPSLAQIGLYNLAHGNTGGGIFEIARVYWPKSLPLTEQPHEPKLWAGLWFGQTTGGVFGQSRAYDFFDAKGAVEVWLEALGLANRVVFSRCDDVPWFHAGRAAELTVDGVRIGLIGELHPETAEAFDVPRAIYGECYFEAVEQVLDLGLRVESLPRFPASLRDLAVVVDTKVDAQELVKAAALVGEASSLLESCRVFDVYKGKGIPDGCQSLAFSFVYRAPDRTLTDEEVAQTERAILAAWSHQFGAQLRA